MTNPRSEDIELVEVGYWNTGEGIPPPPEVEAFANEMVRRLCRA